MNGRIAKLLRDVARAKGVPYQALKKHWLSVPRDERGRIAEGARQYLTKAKP